MKICSFSGGAALLRKGRRAPVNVLRALMDSPRLSTWDMDTLVWLRNAVGQLLRDGLIVEDKSEPYPWHRYTITDKGRALLDAK